MEFENLTKKTWNLRNFEKKNLEFRRKSLKIWNKKNSNIK